MDASTLLYVWSFFCLFLVALVCFPSSLFFFLIYLFSCCCRWIGHIFFVTYHTCIKQFRTLKVPFHVQLNWIWFQLLPKRFPPSHQTQAGAMLLLVSGLAAKQQLHEELVRLVEPPFWRGTSEGGNAGEVAESTAAWSGVRKCIVLSCITFCLGLKLINIQNNSCPSENRECHHSFCDF